MTSDLMQKHYWRPIGIICENVTLSDQMQGYSKCSVTNALFSYGKSSWLLIIVVNCNFNFI